MSWFSDELVLSSSFKSAWKVVMVDGDKKARTPVRARTFAKFHFWPKS